MGNFIFIDESGDPGKPYKKDKKGRKVATGASIYYILSAVCVDSKNLFLAEREITKMKDKYGFKSEIKSNIIPLSLYKDLLRIINRLNIHIFYRVINKKTYKGVFAVAGKKKLNNIFDDYNIYKLVKYAVKMCSFQNTDVVIDRAERRLHKGSFDNFNNYLKTRINTKTLEKVKYVTHTDSEYVYVVQLADLVSGALKDYATGKNKSLKKVIDKKLLKKIY
ncbi:DUF3800 domain-containing protein [bacterium]|nr:DUF3800 domain-containing protein [bacterium]